ncbi:hypothetical protein CsSME_00028605 [Camellia sinensis var. sinensis]
MNFQLWNSRFKLLPTLSKELAVPSIVTLPKLELKPLVASLKYSFLGPNDILLVIIPSNLSSEHECRLLCILKEHKSVTMKEVMKKEVVKMPDVSITYPISNSKGVSHTRLYTRSHELQWLKMRVVS